MITLRPQPLTAEAFAPFGRVIAAAAGAGGPGALAVNGGSAARSEAVPALQLQAGGGRAVLAVYQALARPWPFEARVLERHRLSDQVFLPLGGARRCVLLVAPAGLEQPGPVDCRAFVTDGQQGVCLHAGTWHHGLLALDAGSWAVLERRAETVDCEEWTLGEAVWLQGP